MKASKKLIAGLNRALAEELAAIGRYTVHAEMASNWGYALLHTATEARAHDEMRHAEMLIERVIFLDGAPSVEKPAPIKIGRDVKAQIAIDLADEVAARKLYNDLIELARVEKDRGTEDLLAQILRDEERHLDDLEAQTDQIEQMGLENFLALQVK